MALFDLLAINTKTKRVLCFDRQRDHIWGIDHGLCFAADFKLRTVVWEFGGERIDSRLIDAARRIVDRVPLGVAAVPAGRRKGRARCLQKRAQWVVENPVFPVDQSGRRYPWPMV